MRTENQGHGYRPAGRTERIGSSIIRVISRLQPPVEDQLNGKVTFIPGGSSRSGKYPELERLKERFRKERDAIPAE
jgi:hypothetical protein